MKIRDIFINRKTQRVRPVWRVPIFFIILIAALVAIGGVVGLAVGLILHSMPDPEVVSARLGAVGSQLLGYGIGIGATLFASAICLRVFDKRKLRSIGYQLHVGWWQDYVKGVGVASLMITMIVLLQIALGSLHVSWNENAGASRGRSLLMALVFFNVAACFEELIFRGYPLQTLLLDVRPVIAFITPSTLFALGHLVNPNVSVLAISNTLLAGIWLSVAYFKTRSLWFATGLHFAWNFSMGSVYGLNVSGIEQATQGAIFKASLGGPQWVTGGGYGPEGGIVATVLLILTTVWLWRTEKIKPASESLAGLEPYPRADESAD